MNSHFLIGFLSTIDSSNLFFGVERFASKPLFRHFDRTAQTLESSPVRQKMMRNDDIVEDFVPIEQYSMHSIGVDHINTAINGSHELTINSQMRDNFSEQHNCETIASNVSRTHINPKGVHEIAFYGWRRKCLYFFIVLVTVAVIINAALTLWIIAVLSFSWVCILSYYQSFIAASLHSTPLHSIAFLSVQSRLSPNSIKFVIINWIF